MAFSGTFKEPLSNVFETAEHCCSLHWTNLLLLYALFLQWSIIATKTKYPFPHPPNTPISSARTIILCSFVSHTHIWSLLKAGIFLKESKKRIVPPKESFNSISIGTFLTIYDVRNRKLSSLLINSIVWKWTKMREKNSNGDYYLPSEYHSTRFIWIPDIKEYKYSNGKVTWLGPPFEYCTFGP